MKKWLALLMILLLGVGISGVYAFTINYNNGVLTIIVNEGESISHQTYSKDDVRCNWSFNNGILSANVTSSGQIQINVTIEDTSGNPVFQGLSMLNQSL